MQTIEKKLLSLQSILHAFSKQESACLLSNNITQNFKYMRKILFTLAFACIGIAGASAQDVYFYSNGSNTSLLTGNNVQRIEFNDGAVAVILADGTKLGELATTAFDYFLFYNKEIVNNIKSASSAEGIEITYDGVKDVTVKSAETISSIDVYSADGVMIASVSPKAKSAKISLASYAAGVYLVKASAGNGTATCKIVK